MSENLFGDAGREAPREVDDVGGRFPFGEVPSHIDILPESGREVLVIGDPEGCREFNHRQGDNPYGFQGTCGLVSCEDVLKQFKVEADESDVIRHAVSHGLCDVSDNPASSGSTTAEWQAEILSDGGVPAHPERGGELGDLARWVQEGRGMIIEVNAGELWNDPNAYENGDANHAIVVTGVAVEPMTGAVLGFYVNDSGRGFPADSGRFVSAELMQRAWVAAGGTCVITDVVRGN